jgi:hypothetical protein
MLSAALACLFAVPALADGDTDADGAAIRAAVLDYVEGWFASDPDRMAQVLHPSLFKVRVRTLGDTGVEILDTVDAQTLVAYAGHNQEWVKGRQTRDLEIIYQDARIAVVHAVSDGFYDICNLVKQNGEWKIIQVLWDVNDLGK